MILLNGNTDYLSELACRASHFYRWDGNKDTLVCIVQAVPDSSLVFLALHVCCAECWIHCVLMTGFQLYNAGINTLSVEASEWMFVSHFPPLAEACFAFINIRCGETFCNHRWQPATASCQCGSRNMWPGRSEANSFDTLCFFYFIVWVSDMKPWPDW